MASTDALISLKNAGYRSNESWLVKSVDLDVFPAEIITLIGPNGSGKSTTAKLALGIYNPDEGSASRKSGLSVGYVPQKLQIDWTVPLLVDRFMSLTYKLTKEQMSDALSRTGVAHLARSEVRLLSGGEFQRVQLARAIARQPDLLVLDEPVQGVDFNGEIALYELISDIRNEIGCGVLMISHDLHVVMAATDKVVCLNGHVCCSGAPVQVAQSAEYKELFGMRSAAALAVYEHDHDHTHLPDGRVDPASGCAHDG